MVMDITPSAKIYFNSKNSQYLMEETIFLETFFNKLFSLQTVHLYCEKAVL